MAKNWLALLILVVLASARAQSPPHAVTISGMILDPSGAFTPGATIALKQGSRVRSQVKTDALGSFRIEAVSPGNYSIEVQHKGFKPSTTSLKVTQQRPTQGWEYKLQC